MSDWEVANTLQASEGKDEGEAVGSEKLQKVAIGRQRGVADLVEVVEKKEVAA